MSPSGDKRNRMSAPLQGGSGSPPGQMQGSAGRYRGSGGGMSQNMPQGPRPSPGGPMAFGGPQGPAPSYNLLGGQGLPTPQPGMVQNMGASPQPRPSPMPPPWASQPAPTPASYGVPGGTVIPRGFMGAGMPAPQAQPTPAPSSSPAPMGQMSPSGGPSPSSFSGGGPVESGGPSASPIDQGSDPDASPQGGPSRGRMSPPWMGSASGQSSDPQTLRQGAQQSMNRRNNTF